MTDIDRNERRRAVWIGAAALLPLAANSLLARLALHDAGGDAASYTTVRLLAGAAMLWLLMAWRGRPVRIAGSQRDWLAAGCLFLYAVAFSFAYLGLHAGLGALILFGTVQIAMFAVGLREGERLGLLGWFGWLGACAGLVWLLAPGADAPPLWAAALMAVAGLAWAGYSLIGRRAGDPLDATSGHFNRAALMALPVWLIGLPWARFEIDALGLAVISGALTSALGYVIWNRALPGLGASRAATLQLSVPVLAAAASVLWLGEPLTIRLLLAGTAVILGVALVVATRVHAIERHAHPAVPPRRPKEIRP